MDKKHALKLLNHKLEEWLNKDDPSEYNVTGHWAIWIMGVMKMLVENMPDDPNVNKS